MPQISVMHDLDLFQRQTYIYIWLSIDIWLSINIYVYKRSERERKKGIIKEKFRGNQPNRR